MSATGFRLPTELVERLDAYAERLRAEHPGLSLSRTDAVRELLTFALDQKDGGQKPRRGGKR